ncbi:hypothetical protein EROM_070530 [Encephalitozoon romaleae SJ-2008]|uniref:Uncharacterized protein n=1 Tax=Encephalitozoon romaleae (strain SJ-2008) TaxID=1178016 RepID=I7ANF9_ENCRO|nr:hypothetical protein EROM_070530 [Encephalitozoon romaleae SJ-2008]AFN83304.1 hypothetical protein EROM_070530 [Encephalitozoon romaleae SJ-2008]
MKGEVEFLESDSPGRRPCTYTRSQAMALYEEHRKHILKELIAREVQKRITNKILGKRETEEGLLFIKHRHDTSMDGISGMLTDGEYSISLEEKGVCDEDRTQYSKTPHSPPSSLDTGRCKPNANLRRPERFVDVEACVSGDEGNSLDADEGDPDDLSFIASSDEDYEAPTKKHNRDMLKINKRILRNLKKKFMKKAQSKAFFGPEGHTEKEPSDCEVIEEEDIDVSEDTVEDIVEDFMFSKEEMEYPHEAKPFFTKPGQIEFTENIKLAEKRLGERKSGWDFDESK